MPYLKIYNKCFYLTIKLGMHIIQRSCIQNTIPISYIHVSLQRKHLSYAIAHHVSRKGHKDIHMVPIFATILNYTTLQTIQELAMNLASGKMTRQFLTSRPQNILLLLYPPTDSHPLAGHWTDGPWPWLAESCQISARKGNTPHSLTFSTNTDRAILVILPWIQASAWAIQGASLHSFSPLLQITLEDSQKYHWVPATTQSLTLWAWPWLRSWVSVPIATAGGWRWGASREDWARTKQQKMACVFHTGEGAQ